MDVLFLRHTNAGFFVHMPLEVEKAEKLAPPCTYTDVGGLKLVCSE